MRKLVCLVLAVCLLLGAVGALAGGFTPGVYEGAAQGFGGMVNVKVTVDDSAITAIAITGDGETPAIGGGAIQAYNERFIGKDSAEVDGVAGATITSTAVKAAVADALAQARGEAQAPCAIAFTPGTYEGKAQGYNGEVVLGVTFTQDAISNIEVIASKETEHVGDSAYPIMFEDIMKFTSTGVDTVAGATFTSRAVLGAVNDAAAQAGCDVAALQKGTVPFGYTAQDPIEDTYDVVIVGAGGAGMAAGAAAAQNGATVIVLEKNAEMGGNTLVSGGSFQAVADAFVFDPANPEATTGIDPLFGEVEKSKNELGRLATLRTILGWSEAPFDAAVTDPAAIKSVDDYNLPARGVHQQFLPTLLALKDQIRAYLAYADEHMAAGEPETSLTLFSTKELHIFQTYYGGLRLNADKTEWIVNEYDLVAQIVNNAFETKLWLADQGAQFAPNRATGTLIGCLWQRINGITAGVVDGETYPGKWGVYFKVPENTILKGNEKNQIMTRVTVKELLTDESGAVTGVKGERYDGTPVIMHASKGVILATGGYPENIPMVQQTNTYWAPKDLTDDLQSTSRNSLQGDGIVMGQAVGAALTGMGWTQLMPLGWVDNGDLAGGAGENVIFISPSSNANAGHRYVDESAERDVLSQGAFDYGDDKGVYVELSNGVLADPAADPRLMAVEGRTYYCTLEEAGQLLGIDPAVIEKTVTEYDAYIIGTSDTPSAPAKSSYTATIGSCDKDENGNYLPETYRIDRLKVRFMRPSTHHTMGGLVVDTQRQVLGEDGTAIDGLYAAGEVTGGFFAGNRLGGNAIIEILVSGRIAGETVANK